MSLECPGLLEVNGQVIKEAVSVVVADFPLFRWSAVLGMLLAWNIVFLENRMVWRDGA